MPIPQEKRPIQKTEATLDWTSALLPTLLIAKDYEYSQLNSYIKEKATPELKKEPESHEYVRFSDCDPFGHLNNSKYIDYFMNARDHHLREAYQVDLATHTLKHRENWLVKEHRISYLKPAKLKEQIRIRSRLLDFSENETFVESLMLDQVGKQMKALLWSRFSYVNLNTGRLAPHPEYIIEILKSIKISSEYSLNNFEGRVRMILSELRTQFIKNKSQSGSLNDRT